MWKEELRGGSKHTHGGRRQDETGASRSLLLSRLFGESSPAVFSCCFAAAAFELARAQRGRRDLWALDPCGKSLRCCGSRADE
jgi:hypothetical protein